MLWLGEWADNKEIEWNVHDGRRKEFELLRSMEIYIFS